MEKIRYYTLDVIRGFTLIHMIVYHTLWDIVNLFEKDWKWFWGIPGDLWQQYICWSFILISGFCVSLGKNTGRKAVILLLCGAVISAVTLIIMPDDRVLFGVLTMIGSCTLFMIPVKSLLKRIHPYKGAAFCFLFFLFFQNINKGYLGFFKWKWILLPQSWYANLFTTYWGLPASDFYSSDYFSIFPWYFLFLTGYFLYQIWEKNHWLPLFTKVRNRPLEWIGKRSLIIYMIHQPIIYIILLCLQFLIRIQNDIV